MLQHRAVWNRRQILHMLGIGVGSLIGQSLLSGCAVDPVTGKIKDLLFTGCLIFVVLFYPPLLLAENFILYDPTAGSLPNEQPWLRYFSQGTAVEQPGTGGVRLTTAAVDQTGYSNYTLIPQALKNPAFPDLDRNMGFTLFFELQVHSETHLSNDRAGFSIILLADDHKGMEMGFWEDEIWVQTDTPELFTHGEGVKVDTTGSRKLYSITLKRDNYSLYQNGMFLLTGTVKDYSSFNGEPFFNPYQLSSFLFLGDDTIKAGADITLGKIVVQTDFPWGMFLPAMTVVQ